MITDSSKDYGTGKVLITFDGDPPSVSEISEYCQRNYGFAPRSLLIFESDMGYGGYQNPGTVHAHPDEGYFSK